MDLQSNRDLAELLRKIGVRDTTKLRLQDTEMPVVLTGTTLQQAKPVLPGKALVSAEVPAPGVGVFGGIVLRAQVDCMIELVASSVAAWVMPDQSGTFGFTIGAAIARLPYGDPNTPPVSTGALATSAADPALVLGGIPTSGGPSANVWHYPEHFQMFIPSGGRLWVFTTASNISANIAICFREPK